MLGGHDGQGGDAHGHRLAVGLLEAEQIDIDVFLQVQRIVGILVVVLVIAVQELAGIVFGEIHLVADDPRLLQRLALLVVFRQFKDDVHVVGGI